MKWVRKCLSSILAVCLMGMLANPVLVYGAAATINSVSIRVGLNEFEPGDTLPDIVIGDKDSGGGAYAYANSEHYFIEKAEWVTSRNKTIQVGDVPRMKIWLEATDYDNRRFKGGYQSSNVKVTGGTFKSASISSRKLVVTVDLNPVKGQFESPEEAYWNGSGYGDARWKMGNNSSASNHYEVALYRGNSQVHKAETTGTRYDFYPYMTKKGTYHFRVRVVPADSAEGKYGKSSDWISSDEVYLPEEDAADGSGQANQGVTPSGGNTAVGWIKSGDKWYFRYPDGSSPKDEWVAWDGKWYLFDANGWMLTGWQNRNGVYYYLDGSGAMLTGWVQAGNTVYYLNPTKDEYEGIMVTNRWIVEGENYYYLNADGIRAEGWTEINGNYYYFYPGTGIRAANTSIDGFVLDGDGIWRK